MSEKSEPYTVTVREGSTLLDRHSIADPFIRTCIRPRGLKALLGVLLNRYEVEVSVSADRETEERVLELNPDYRGVYGSERRRAWDTQVNAAFMAFAGQDDDDEVQP